MTRILKADQVDPDIRVAEEAAAVIRDGGTVVFPTETVYGLGASAYSADASMKIFRAKNRPPDNPLIVHVCSMEQLGEFTLPPGSRVMGALEKIWPGPLTVLLERNQRIPDAVTAGLETVAVRMPANPLALKLIEQAGVPVAAPSANIATRPSIVDSREAISELDGRVDMILDAGPTFFGMESTIVNTSVEPVELMRPGAFEQEELERYFGRILISDVARGISMSDVAITPGMKYRHYSPDTEMYLVDDMTVLDGIDPSSLMGSFTPLMSSEALRSHNLQGISLGSSGNMYEVARNLYPSFRRLESMGTRKGLIEPFPEKGIGLAVMNRIRKAATGRISSRRDLLSVMESP